MEMIQGKDKAKHDKLRYQLRQIIKALGWWTDQGGWKNISAIGALIQQKAQELTGITADMSTLKDEAEAQLKRLKNEAAMATHLEQQRSQSQINMMPGKAFYPFVSMPFPSFVKGMALTPKTRREELEEMTDGQIREIFRKKQAKEIKKDHINYILESEKEYK
jgi:hypothetical protein